MKKVLCLLLFSVLLIMLSTTVMLAQEDPGPGEGGPIVWANQRGSANLGPLTPLQCSGVDCSDPNGLMYPSLISVHPETLAYAPYDPEDPLTSGFIATGWEISEDATSITVTMREDATWNDGTPITAADAYFVWEAAQNGDQFDFSSSLSAIRRDLVNAEIIDDYTIRFDLDTASCDIVRPVATIGLMPAHYYGYVPGEDFDFTALATDPARQEPSVTAGPFNFARVEAGTAVFFAANADYYDPVNSVGVIPEGVVYLDVPDYNVMAERLLANQTGDVNFIHEPSTSIVPTLRDGGAQVFESPGRVWHYVSLNVADPNDPRFGLDEDGNPIDQGNHPILGDVRVRQAMQHAVNIDEIIASAQNGNASPMVSSVIPSAWTVHPTLERRPFDLDIARELLEEAGWVSTGSPLVDGGDGLRTCQGCEYAEEGTEMFLTIYAPDQPRTDAAVLLQASFAQIGIDLEVQTLDFNAMYDDNLGAQTFDMAVAGWRGGLPFDPDQRAFFGVENDIPGLGTDEYGFNFGSWYNEEWQELNEYIKEGAIADGCSPESIQEAAYRAQEIIWEEQPYLWLYAQNSAYAVNDSVVSGWDPLPLFGEWNIDTWVVRQ